MKNLVIDETDEQDSLPEFSLLEEMSNDWEVGEYKWLESLKRMTIEENESGLSQKWFKFDEERQEHQELDHFMKELRICDTGGGHDRGDNNILSSPVPIGLNSHPQKDKNEIFVIKLSNKSKWTLCKSCREVINNLMINELSHDKDNAVYCSGLKEHDHLLGEEPELHVGAGEHGLPPEKPTKPENKGNNDKDNNTSYAGSCNAPSESGGDDGEH